ncbi:aminodeoxychorismate synthase [Gracilaria domingensis]|nr:aminodeoxychorismate synthase [Gracilaria domingensis]
MNGSNPDGRGTQPEWGYDPAQSRVAMGKSREVSLESQGPGREQRRRNRHDVPEIQIELNMNRCGRLPGGVFRSQSLQGAQGCMYMNRSCR